MITNTSGGRVIRVASVGHAVFAAIMIGLGIQGIVTRDFPPIWGGVPDGMPARVVLALICAIVSLGCGIGLLFQRTAVTASRALLTYLFAWLLLFRFSYVFFAPLDPDTWWACGDTAVMMAGAWVLYNWLSDGQPVKRFRFVTGEKGLRIARVCYGLAMIPFGIAHFTYFAHTVELVPGWLPWHEAWVSVTGAGFIAAGIAILLGFYVRLAITLSAVQLLVFTMLVWVPVVVAGVNASQWAEFVDSCALTAAAWVVAESSRGIPWLALGRR